MIVRWHTGSYFADRWRLIIESIDYMLGRYPEFESELAGDWLGSGAARHSPSLPSAKGPRRVRGLWGVPFRTIGKRQGPIWPSWYPWVFCLPIGSCEPRYSRGRGV